MFRSYVIFAEMRTGSNLLEATLNRIYKITCHGEAFNPAMLGWPNNENILGCLKGERDLDPFVLLDKISWREDHLSGFRYFHDHDPRVLETILNNKTCAKIILTRNAVESYVSVKQATETQQWKLNSSEVPRNVAVTFDFDEFAQEMDAKDAFRGRVLRSLQETGQTAFFLDYSDLRDIDVMNGLLSWLGRPDVVLTDVASDQIPQNPVPLEDRVNNFAEMSAELSKIDSFDLGHFPAFERKRGASSANAHVFGGGDGLIYFPVDGASFPAGLSDQPFDTGFNQSTLRDWKKNHPNHRSFSIVRHPGDYAWNAFLRLGKVRQEFQDVLRDDFGVIVNLPEDDMMGSFHNFLLFVKRNLNGQTSMPVLPIWASQTEIIAGVNSFSQLDSIIRESEVDVMADALARLAGLDYQPNRQPVPARPWAGCDKIEKALRAAYRRDFMNFGKG
ncbi:hypothetical protein [Paracoccus sp. (in: a-proteobacteria)]|uniref:hypothetical protein n=1 Tax=Paracoccus sp. TaxID=267 RepID=UPI0026E08857|nr:hypothetical protein [Paracoccus sp. (in: a-proteobacteria)]MDO5648883.1 hypothetical protein [Paracoccus sp. (in: a-proteobacteria)]